MKKLRIIAAALALVALGACDDSGQAFAASDDIVFSITERATVKQAFGGTDCRITMNIQNNTKEHLARLVIWIDYEGRRYHNDIGHIPKGEKYTFEDFLRVPCESLSDLKLDVAVCQLRPERSSATERACPKPVVFQPNAQR